MEKIRELVEENQYTLFPIHGQKTGIDKITLSINDITNRVDLKVYYTEQAHIESKQPILTKAEQDKLSRHTRRLTTLIKRKLAKEQ